MRYYVCFAPVSPKPLLVREVVMMETHARDGNMRLLVCGGRHFRNRAWLFKLLDGIASRNDVKLIIHGAAFGADKLAGEWAKKNKVPVSEFPANWSLGLSAGPIRNRQMLDEGKPTHCLALPGGKGTEGMVKMATAAGVKMWVLR